MQRSFTTILALSLACSAFFLIADRHTSAKQEGNLMNPSERNIEVMRELFRAVEQRDAKRAFELYHPNVEFHWPPPLPYGGSTRGAQPDNSRLNWGEIWALVQPTEEERRLDPRFVAANDTEVVVLWQQKGMSPAGERFRGEVLGLYTLQDGKLARAQMFYFDPVAANNFLARSITPELRERAHQLFTRLRHLDFERQRAVREAYWNLQLMTPEQRKRQLEAGTLAGTFSSDDLDLLTQLLKLTPDPGEKSPR